MSHKINLYNTLTRKIEDFIPIKPGEVTLYTCGPTVYHYYHIGNLRNAVFNDTLRRALTAAGYDVRHVMNITDVGHLASDADAGEDKLHKRAASEGKTPEEVARFYTDAFKADMAALNVLPPSVNPDRAHNREQGDSYARATDFIPEQIDMVIRLLDKEFAYITDQAIYFDVAQYPKYGELTGQRLADKETGARDSVVTDEEKRSPYDFAVWFFTTGRFADHAMRWASPWGDGFPGWHLECSAIIHATLDGHTASDAGHPIDIHTGGIDHIGTHHPNEMAQTEAAFGHQLARVWMHNNFMLVDGAKMSKSKGNAYRLQDIIDRGFSPLALRMLYLQAHYQTEINFTWESLEAAQNRLLDIYAWADLKWQAHLETDSSEIPRDWLNDDMNELLTNLDTPTMLASLSRLITWTTPSPISAKFIKPFRDLTGFGKMLNPSSYKILLNQADALLGLDLANRPDITGEQKQLIADRQTARETKNWAKSDEIRDQLAAAPHQLAIDDTPNGPRWRRTKI